jgi:tRNA(Ile)-lysidine synthase
MASTRRSPRAERDPAAVAAAVERALAPLAGRRLGIALSGGRDSVALLSACAEVAPAHAVALTAIHVHHGLSPRADDWVAACERLAAMHGVPLVVRRVRVAHAEALGVEAAARAARYAALREAAREVSCDAIALAHHRDDQAETLLLQLLRGAGPHGLAGMPATRQDADGVVWLRPLLDVPRAAIEAWVRERGLAYVDDDSNASARHRRNALRLDVMPALERAFPAAAKTLARAAMHQADAARLLDDIAQRDAEVAVRDDALDCAAIAALPPERARNLLRWYLRTNGLPVPSTARLAAMLAQLGAPRRDARVLLEHAGRVIGVHRGRAMLHAPPPPPYALTWQGEADLRLPHGRLAFVASRGEGLAAERLAGRAVTVAGRSGGERFRPDASRPRRALAAWLAEAALPPWERDALPLVLCDGEVVAVAAFAVDAHWRAVGAAPGWRLDWRPDRPGPPGA